MFLRVEGANLELVANDFSCHSLNLGDGNKQENMKSVRPRVLFGARAGVRNGPRRAAAAPGRAEGGAE